MLSSDGARLVDLHELSLEDQGRVGGDNTANSTVAVGKVRGDGELALLANLHAQKALVPALDDLAIANGEGERVTAVVAGIELLAAGESALVVDVNGVTCVARR